MLDTAIDEGTRVILWIIEANNLCDIQVLEDVHVAAG